ncbi:MAG: hypothetical protein ACI31F_09240 [Muribaculaceae bacterium]
MPKISQSWGENGCFAENLTIFFGGKCRKSHNLGVKMGVLPKISKTLDYQQIFFGTIFEM